MIAIGFVLFIVAVLVIRIRDTLVTDWIDGLCGLTWLLGVGLMTAGAVVWLWRVAP